MHPISREDAHRFCEAHTVLVEAKIGGFPALTPFTRESPFYHSSGPYDYAGLRYFLAGEPSRPFSTSTGGSPGKPAKGGSGSSGGGEATEVGQDPGPAEELQPEENLKRTLAGRFLVESAYCGDAVSMEVSGANLPAKPTLKIEMLSREDKALLETLVGTLDPLPYKAAWVAKKNGDSWEKRELVFRAEAAGTRAESGNKFRFKRFPDHARETRTLACASGIFGWTGKFDIEFKAGILHVTTKVKLINRSGAKPAPGDPLPAAGDPVSDDDKTSMKEDVESKLSGKWFLHRKKCQRGKACNCDKQNGCCKFRVRVHLEFVEAGEHHVVNLFQGAGRANASNWTRVKTRDNSWAHETGHLLGWYDEYVGGAVGTAPRWKAPHDVAVMSSGLKVPFEYYWDFRDWLKEKASEDWEGTD